MKTLTLTTLCILVFVVPARAADADKIIGSWSIVKMDGKELPKEAELIVTFSKDGKMTLAVKVMGKEDAEEGAYTVTGNKISATKKGKKEADIITIKSVTGDTMVLVDEKEKKEMELKKKK